MEASPKLQSESAESQAPPPPVRSPNSVVSIPPSATGGWQNTSWLQEQVRTLQLRSREERLRWQGGGQIWLQSIESCPLLSSSCSSFFSTGTSAGASAAGAASSFFSLARRRAPEQGSVLLGSSTTCQVH